MELLSVFARSRFAREPPCSARRNTRRRRAVVAERVRAMGVEPRTAAEVVTLAEDAVAAGLDATQVYSLDLGHGYRPTVEEMSTYLRTVLDDAPGDLVISTHQSVGYHYPPSRIAELL